MACPDLRPHFKYIVERPMPHSFGVPVISDWADKADDDPVFGKFKQCGFWTRDEAAILYEAARQLHDGCDWLDIGGHTGWTAAHIAAAGGCVSAIDPMYANPEFERRVYQNLDFSKIPHINLRVSTVRKTSDQFFAEQPLVFIYHGVVIDGDHERPHPLHDAQNATKFLRPTGVIMLHDAIGPPVQDGVAWLAENGFKVKVYLTPHVVACCWRGELEPPSYTPDPFVVRHLEHMLPDWMLACA